MTEINKLYPNSNDNLKCIKILNNGNRCKRNSKKKSNYCWQHQNEKLKKGGVKIDTTRTSKVSMTINNFEHKLSYSDKITIPTVVKIQRMNNQIIQDCDLYIGRQCFRGGWELNKSKWANPFSLNKHDLKTSLDKYRNHIIQNEKLMNSLIELSGKRLGCWCHNRSKFDDHEEDKCHGDILVKLFMDKFS